MNGELIAWTFRTGVLVLIAILGYIWKRSEKRIDDMQKKHDADFADMRNKYDAELNDLRTDYRQQFGLIHANINDTKETILGRIATLELNIERNFVTKNVCRETMENIKE
jgi:uncharacterized membrane-anchored protein YhcB (DUF1043 family)